MAHPGTLTSGSILQAAMHLIEQGGSAEVSLRAVATSLNVKAPSLYRYFQDKGALDTAVAGAVLGRMRDALHAARKTEDVEKRLYLTAEAYLRFARRHPALYSFVFRGQIQKAYYSSEGKALWTLLLNAVSSISGREDDTPLTVAIWSFLHGYATLEGAGGFGDSGPKGALQVGLRAFLEQAARRD